MRAAVLGHPISHSLSPLLHRAAYDALGLSDWHYEAVDVDVAGLAGFLATLGQGWAGLSLTMPLKQAVIPLIASISETASTVGSVNTLVPDAGAGWRGENTDIDGIEAALTQGGSREPTTGLVLGAGATAASALAALARLGVRRVVAMVRSPARARGLSTVAARLGVDVRVEDWPASPASAAVLLQADVVVATAPAFAADPVAAMLAVGGASPQGTLLDVVYEPRPTTLTAVWTAIGGRAVQGTAMLLHQAAAQVDLMTGRTAPLRAMASALETHLAEPS